MQTSRLIPLTFDQLCRQFKTSIYEREQLVDYLALLRVRKLQELKRTKTSDNRRRGSDV